MISQIYSIAMAAMGKQIRPLYQLPFFFIEIDNSPEGPLTYPPLNHLSFKLITNSTSVLYVVLP